MKISRRHIPLIAYLVFMIIPLYWMLNCSFKFTTEIMTTLTWIPEQFTVRNYQHIFGSEVWMGSFVNTLSYVLTDRSAAVLAWRCLAPFSLAAPFFIPLCMENRLTDILWRSSRPR